MKKSSLLFICISVLLFSCDKENASNSPISGGITNQSECKNNKSFTGNLDIADSLSCISYTYDASVQKLVLTHYNAGFNCCPGNIYCEIESYNDSIVVTEYETRQDCNCLCLFDLEIELNGVQAKNYKIIFKEPYVDNQQELIFNIDLAFFNQGDYCVVRKEYPWGP